MAEYIDLEKLLAKIDEAFFETDPDGKEQIGVLKCRAIIREIPTADVAPVVHGRFVHDGPRFVGGVDWWHCSNCGGLVSGAETRFDYCPHCGARMDGDAERRNT